LIALTTFSAKSDDAFALQIALSDYISTQNIQTTHFSTVRRITFQRRRLSLIHAVDVSLGAIRYCFDGGGLTSTRENYTAEAVSFNFNQISTDISISLEGASQINHSFKLPPFH
jgi:hypothetical protein